MIFLISFLVAAVFVLLPGRALRAHPAPFYAAATALAAAAAVLTWSGLPLPAGVFSQYIWPVFARGGLAGSLFVIVMFTGAFPNGSWPIKRLMPIRGPLSILASILTLGHNAAYGKTYFRLLFTAPASLPPAQLGAAVCSVAMLVIMLPLFATSFQSVRRKMAPKTWKRLQRWAYGFYGLLACHILLLTVPAAMRGDPAYQLTAFVYAAVFLSYLACRVSKALAKRNNHTAALAKRQTVMALCSAALSAVVVLPMGGAMPSVSAAAAPPPAESLPAPTASPAEPAPAEPDGFQDGVYTGSAMGMNANIEVSVTIENGQIAQIDIDSHRDDEPYFTDALSVIDGILASNGTQVDTVSGATYSSGGILDAVDDALEKAGGGA